MRLRGRVDRTHAEIRDALRAFGTVESLANLGGGVPDLLFGCRVCRRNHLIEAKDGQRPPSERVLTDDEQRFADEWQGERPVLLESADQAIAWAKSHRHGGSIARRGKWTRPMPLTPGDVQHR